MARLFYNKHNMCRSKTVSVWAAATIPDYTVHIEDLFEMQFERNIEMAVPDIQKLEGIVPEILDSANVYDHIIFALRQAIEGGHIASYRLLIPIYLEYMAIFDNTVTSKIGFGNLRWGDRGFYGHPYKFWNFHEELPDALFDAVTAGYDTKEEDILSHIVRPGFGASAEKVFRYKEGSSRDRTLKEVAEHRYFPHEEFQKYIESYVCDGNDKVAQAFIDYLMSDKRQDPSSPDMRHHREAALSSALYLTILRRPYRMVHLILPIYVNLRLNQFGELYTFKNDVLDRVSAPYWMVIYTSREQVWNLIKSNKPSSARSDVFRRLKLSVSDLESDLIRVFGGSAQIYVYDDILCYRSQYFRDLDWESVAWRHEVHLGDKVDGASLPVLGEFFHSGMLGKGLSLESLRNLRKAAGFLGIDEFMKLCGEATSSTDSE